jgi:hypothetical protein
MNTEIDILFDIGFNQIQKDLFKRHCSYLAQLFFTLDAELAESTFSVFENLRVEHPDCRFESETLKNTLDLIVKQQQLNKFPVLAFICSIHNVDDNNAITINNEANAKILQFRILEASLSLLRLDGYEETVRLALDAFRRIVTNKNNFHILDSLHKSLTPKAEDFVYLIKNADVGKHHLQALATLLKEYELQKPSYKKKSRKTALQSDNESKVPEHNSVKSGIQFEADEHVYNEYVVYKQSNRSTTVEKNETIADEKSAKKYYEFKLVAPEEVQTSLRLQSKIANSAAAAIQRREKQLVTEFRHLTQHEVSVLMNECTSCLKDEIAFAHLLVLLFLGRTIEQIVKENNNISIGRNPPFVDNVILQFQPNLPKHELKANLESLVERPNGSVLLILPKFLTDAVISLKARIAEPPFIKVVLVDELIKQLSSAISEINTKHKTRITLARIQNFMGYQLNVSGADATEVALLRGTAIEQEPGCSYYQVDVQKLVDLHSGYVSQLCKGTRYSIDVLSKKTNLRAGSYLQIKIDKLGDLLYLLRDRAQGYSLNGWNDLELVHNTLTLYTLLILNISTGHRPVRHPFHSINCFDLQVGTVFISDKEVRSAQSARVIKLPDIALMQLRHYIQHLESIRPYCRNTGAANTEHIDGALNGSKPFFILFVGRDLISITPKILSDFLDNILPLPLNWNRHFMRTWLREQGIESSMVDAWMGHVGSGGEPFSRYSGLAMTDLALISDEINILLKYDLKVNCIVGFGGKSV